MAKPKIKAASKPAKKGKAAPAKAVKVKTAPVKNKPAAKPKPSKPVKVAAPKKSAKPAPSKASAAKKPIKAAAKPVAKPVKTVTPKAVAVAKPATAKPVAVQAKSAPTPKPAPAKPVIAVSNSGKKEKMAIAATAGKDTGVTKEDGRYALPSNTQIELPAGYKPKADEEYMNPRQLAFFRRKLQTWREDLVEESKQTIDNLRDEVRDVGDEAERATRETENSLELRTRDRYRKLISKIDKALKRIEEGRYGYCEETDEEIGVDRLEARPIATLCLDAQERWEHRQKQMGD
jgi:DnaK suppressor protein